MTAAPSLPVDEEVLTLWWIAVAVAAVVTVIAAGLLRNLFEAARLVQSNLGDILVNEQDLDRELTGMTRLSDIAAIARAANEEAKRAERAISPWWRFWTRLHAPRRGSILGGAGRLLLRLVRSVFR